MKEEFFRVKEEFEILGEKTDTETILTEDYILESQMVIVYFYKGNQIPVLGFSFLKNEEFREYRVVINYENCLKED